jgi:flagellar protein FlaG
MNEIKADTVVHTYGRKQLSSAPQREMANAGSDAANVAVQSGKDLPPVTANVPPLNEVDVQEAVQKLNDYVQTTSRTLDFQVDEDSGKTIVRVFDRDSEELIRQIPGELALELARKLNEEEPSLLFSAQV